MNRIRTIDRLSRLKPKTLSLRVIGLLSLLVLITFGLFLHSISIYERTHRFQSPLLTSIKEIRLELESAHHLVETAHQNRFQIDLDQLWHYVDRSLWYLGQITPVSQPVYGLPHGDSPHEIDAAIASLLKHLTAYKAAIETLFSKAPAVEAPGSDTQKLYMLRFEDLQNTLTNLEKSIHLQIKSDRLSFRFTQTALAFAFLVVSVFLIRATYVHEKRKIESYNAVNAANAKAQRETRRRLKTDQALERSERLFRTLFQTSPDAFVLSRLDNGTIVDVNEGFSQLSHLEKNAVVGKALGDLPLWRDPRAPSQLKRTIEQTGELRNAVVTFNTGHNGHRIGSISSKVIQLDEEPHLLTVARDITELKLAEETLRQSEQQFRSLFESASDAIQLLDPQGRIKLTNPATLKSLGYSEQEVVGQPLAAFIRNEKRPAFENAFDHLRYNGFHRDELELVAQDGSTVTMDCSISTIRDDGGEVKSFVSFQKDITARKLADQRNRAIARFLQIANRHRHIDALLDAYADEVVRIAACDAVAIRIVGDNGYLPFSVNHGFSDEFCQLEMKIPLAVNTCMCGKVIRGETDSHQPYFSQQGSFLTNNSTDLIASLPTAERSALRGMCNRFGFESVALVPIVDGDQTIGVIHLASRSTDRISLDTIQILEAAAMQLGIALRRLQVQEALSRSHQDLEARIQQRTQELEVLNRSLASEIEEHKRTEKQLVLNQKRLRKLSSRLMVAEASERRRIATDIHDRIGQTLAIAKIRLGVLGDELIHEDHRQTMADVRGLITRTIQDTRTLTFELSPPVLYEIGLEAAVDWLGGQTESQTGLPVLVESNSNAEQVSTALRIFLFQSVRELLHNITKHANASAAHVQVQREDDCYRVCVSDDGRGLEPVTHSAQKMGYGLFNIYESMELYGGKMTLDSDSGAGTCFTIAMPLKKGDARPETPPCG